MSNIEGLDFSNVDISAMPSLERIQSNLAGLPADPRVTFDPNTGQYMAGGGDGFPRQGEPGATEAPEDVAPPEEEEDPRIRQIREQIEEIKRQQEAANQRMRQDARDAIRRVLSQYKLESLAEPLWKRFTEEYFDFSNEDAIIFAIKEEDAYKKRFAANAARVAKGMAELSPREYLDMERTYAQVLAANGMPAGFYDSPDDFRKMIEGDVSPSELQDRVREGYRIVADADQNVKDQMRRLYGVSEGDLAAYFIDPERTRPLLVAADYARQARAAQISARGQELANVSLDTSMAEELARRGVTEAEAQTGFREIGNLGELRQQFGGEENISEQEMIRQQFGADTAAQQKLARRKATRLGEFKGGGSFARTTGETSGSIRLGVGEAQ